MTTRLTKASGLTPTEMGITSATNKIANKLESVLIGEIRNSLSFDDAIARVSSRDILVDLRDLQDELIQPLLDAVEEAARDAISSLPSSLQVGVRFDESDVRAISWARNRAGQFVVEISEEVRRQIRELVTRAIREQFTTDKLAQYIRSIVGLHSRWARAVDNMYERTVADLLGQGQPIGVAEARATPVASAYRLKLIRTRAMTIARTEIVAANNAGRYLGWQQAMIQTGIPAGMLRKRWIVGPDGWSGIRVCERCIALSGTEVGVNDLFPSGRLMPPLHPNCRCTAILIFPSEEI